MLKNLLFAVAAVLVALAGFISTRPDAFSVQRSATVQAPAELPFALVNDFHRWAAWSPWEGKDPGMTRTFTGAETGLDSMYEWTGNNEVGAGRMTIVESKPAELVRIRLEFLRPFEAQNTTTFTFTPAGSGVTVTWRMEGRNTFLGKAFSLVMDMDEVVGKDFEAGLAKLKAAAEAQAVPPALPEGHPEGTATAPSP